MSEDRNREIFDKLREFVPRAVNILRVCRMLTKGEFSTKLRKQPCFNSSSETIAEDIRTGVHVLSFEELKVICAVLDDTVEGILKSAYSLSESEKRPESEALRELANNLSYLQYLEDQNRQ